MPPNSYYAKVPFNNLSVNFSWLILYLYHFVSVTKLRSAS